nr:MAG TPA: hypothetical protein [Caudoviricetes sp.]
MKKETERLEGNHDNIHPNLHISRLQHQRLQARHQAQTA